LHTELFAYTNRLNICGAGIGSFRCERIVGDLGSEKGGRIKEGRLARVGLADHAYPNHSSSMIFLCPMFIRLGLKLILVLFSVVVILGAGVVIEP
jgi:hypothetical protein